MNLKTIIILVFFLIISKNSYGYLDPVSGSVLMQTLIGILAAAGAFVINFWKKIKFFVNRLLKKKKKIN